MARAIEPLPGQNDGYVVRAPRITDAIGRSLRRAFGPPSEPEFTDLLRRLDAIH